MSYMSKVATDYVVQRQVDGQWWTINHCAITDEAVARASAKRARINRPDVQTRLVCRTLLETEVDV